MATRPGIESYAVAVMSMFAGGFARYADTHSGEATYRQWFLLTMLANMGEGPHSVRDLADFAGTTRQNAKRMLEPLERRGLVTMRRSQADCRSIDVRMTARGYDYLRGHGTEVARATSAVFALVSDEELEGLVEVLHKLSDGLEAAQAQGDEA